jgi:hexosaminidase
MELIGGRYALTPETSIVYGAGTRHCAELLREYLAVTGLPLPVTTTGSGIALRLSDRGRADEEYRLEAGEAGVEISASGTTGVLHGIQTLRQLMPPEVYAPVSVPGREWAVPGVRITDAPRLRWRGSLLDVGRWCLPIEYLHRYVEMLAMHKLNRFHLHLTDDQGWRFEVGQYPELTRVGAWRAESPLGHETVGRHDGTPHGGYYSQRELRDLVAFAARRGIEVVPEIDMPGHVTAAIAAYPQLGNGDEPIPVSTNWGIHKTVLNLEPSTIRFFESVLDELVDVFPSPWIHVGGDECPTDEWSGSRAVRARMVEWGLTDVTQVQEWFTHQICASLRERGRTPVVWDEAATTGLDENTIVMAWRHEQVGFDAARRGHQVIMCPMQRTYFDWYQSAEPGQPVAHDGVTTLRDVVEYEPVPPSLPDGVRARVLGAQAQLWTEYLPTPQRVDEMAYPRLCALAERAWSAGPTDYVDFTHRLATHRRRLTGT